MSEEHKTVSRRPANQPSRMSPFDEMEQFFEKNNWLNPFLMRTSSWPDFKSAIEGNMPRVDVINRDSEVMVLAALPGVNKEDVDLSVLDDVLTLKATMRHESHQEEGEYHHRELSRGELMRTLKLPATVDASQARASFNNGMLELILPKLEAVKRQSIKVS